MSINLSKYINLFIFLFRICCPETTLVLLPSNAGATSVCSRLPVIGLWILAGSALCQKYKFKKTIYIRTNLTDGENIIVQRQIF